MIDIDEEKLLRQYIEARDIEIERLLDQYGTSLKETREMYPQLMGAISKRQLLTTLPTQPIFFTPSEAAEMGLALQEGWMLKMTPTERGYISSFITPSKWEITENDLFISPEGMQYTRTQLEALLGVGTIAPTAEPTYPLTIEDLTEQGQQLYREYQAGGGQLDIAGWLQEQEATRLQMEQIFGRVFPEQDIQEIYDYIQSNPEQFLADLREIGWTGDTEALLRHLIPEITNEEMQAIFGMTAPFVPESWVKDNVIDTFFIVGPHKLGYGLKGWFLSILPSVMESFAGYLKDLAYKAISIPAQVGAFLGLAIEGKPREEAAVEAIEAGRKALEPVTLTADQVISQLLPSIQKAAEQNFLRLVENERIWEQTHPELVPNPRYLQNPFEHSELFRDPGYYMYSFTSSLAYSLAVMGTMVVVSAIASPAAGIPAGVMIAAGPEATSMTEELVRQGIPFEEAAQWGALYGLTAGGIETGSDLFLLGLTTKPFKGIIQPIQNTIFKLTANAIVRGIASGTLVVGIEGIEEVMTQAVHNAVLKHYDETQSITEGLSHVFIQGVIASLPFGALGGAASHHTFRSSLSETTGKQYDDLIAKFQEKGLTLEEAQVEAAKEIARTPEGTQEIGQAIEAAQEEYRREHPEIPKEPELADKLLAEMKIAEEIKVTPVTPEVTKLVPRRPTPGTMEYDSYWADLTPKQQAEELSWLAQNRQQLPFMVVREIDELVKQGLLEKVDPDAFDIVMEAYLGKDYPEYARLMQLRRVAPIQIETMLQKIKQTAKEAGAVIRYKANEPIEIYAPTELARTAILPTEAGMPEVTVYRFPKVGDRFIVVETGAIFEFTKWWGKETPKTMRVDLSGYWTVRDVKTGKKAPVTTNEVREQFKEGIWRWAEPAIPQAPVGMPEVGLQPPLIEGVPAKEIRPEPTGKLVQARLDDYLRLREYNAKAIEARIAEIKKLLEIKGRLPKGQGTKGDLRLELAKLEAQRELDAVKNIGDLDSLIKQVENELGNRELPYHGAARNLFKGYTTRQLEEMLNIYQQARGSMVEAPVLEPTPKPEPTPVEINRVKTDPTPASDEIILKKFIDCIKDAKPAREVTEALKHQELQKRSAVFASILQGGEGYKAFEKAKGALKGFLPQGEYVLDLQKFNITDAEIERMIDRIRLDERLRPFEKLNTYEAFTNLVMGAIPTEGELILLEREFGSDFVKAIMDKMPTREKALRIAQDIANIPRTLVTIADLSATLRQGALLAFGQPVQFSKAFVSQLKVVFSEKNFKLVDEIVHNNIYAEKAEQHKLYVAPISEAVKIAAREEAFMGRLIEKVPIIGSIVRASERAYITMLNVLRMETWAYYCRQWEGTGKTVVDYDKLASFINHATGRGDLGAFSRAAAWLSAMFFSPRFIMSRILILLDLITATPAVRKVIARNLVSFVSVGLLAQVLAELGGGETEKDPRSSDFGKIKIGNTRIDFWAGFQPYVRVIAQIITEERKSTRTGEIYKVDPIDIGVNFFRSKLAPIPGLLWDLKSGKTFIGEELTAENAEKIIFEKLTPMFIQDLVEAVKDSGIAGLGYGILSALGVGIQTYGDNWETAELKLGLPERGDNLPYTVENEIYDVKDYYSEISRMIGGATFEMLLDKKVPEKVLSVAKAKDILREISLIPNKRLVNINADPAKGDTYEQYRVQWLARQKITNADELEKFDKDYPNAYLGNMTQAQYALLVEYHSLPESEKADFLGRHPEIYINPREEWLRTHPEENALLALWGKAKTYSLEALNKASTLAKSLGIPENALIIEEIDAITQFKLKHRELFDLLDAYSGLDDTFKGPDGLTARDRAIKELYAKNPDFRNDMRRIEALSVGTEKNPTPELMIEGWVERGQIVDEFGASSAEAKLWLIDNKEVHQWALENGLLTDTGEKWNEPILRLQVAYREEFERYEAYGNKASVYYIANDTVRAQAREAMVFDTFGRMTSFGVAYYTIGALQKGLPDNLVTTYVDYYGIRKKEGVDYSAGWYEDDWFILEHREFYQAMINLGLWQPRDFSKVPTREVWKLYQTYLGLPTGQPRLDFRRQNKALDDWLVKAKGYTPVGGR